MTEHVLCLQFKKALLLHWTSLLLASLRDADTRTARGRDGPRTTRSVAVPSGETARQGWGRGGAVGGPWLGRLLVASPGGHLWPQELMYSYMYSMFP